MSAPSASIRPVSWESIEPHQPISSPSKTTAKMTVVMARLRTDKPKPGGKAGEAYDSERSGRAEAQREDRPQHGDEQSSSLPQAKSDRRPNGASLARRASASHSSSDAVSQLRRQVPA